MRDGWSERLCRQEFARGWRAIQHKRGVMRPESDDASKAEVERRVDALECAAKAS